MHGTNPIREPAKGDGSSLDVQAIFPTIQGEGPYAGMPAVFIRLGGCNLACDFCDTEFESFRAMGLDEIMARVLELTKGDARGKKAEPAMSERSAIPLRGQQAAQGILKLIVITGGEPLRQPIAPLCQKLIAAGFKVQVETNGTLWRPLPDAVEIVCSPKNNGAGYFRLRPDLLARVSAIKFIVSAQKPEYADIADVGQGDIPVFVQPMDEYNEQSNAANLKLAMELAQRHGYRLSLQLHKIIGVE